MPTVSVPYGRGQMNFTLEPGRLRAVLRPETPPEAHADETALVRQALERPIGSERLCRLAEKARRVLVITSDHTRPVPSRITLPPLLAEIRALNPAVEIRILLATGFHRPSTPQEILDKAGPEVAARETIVNHDSSDENHLVFKGVLPSGGELWVNDLVDWADLIVAEGFIEPHFFAGFSGGRKSVLPGIAGTRTIFANHCAEFIAHPAARTGNLRDNPLHRDMVWAARTVGLAFILNVILDEHKRVTQAFAGHSEAAHEAGCAAALRRARVERVPADIVITGNGGHPLDQNIYQAVKGMTAAEACVRPGGVILMTAACGDGAGGDAFARWFREAPDAGEVARRIEGIPRDRTHPDQWEAQILARVLRRATVILLSRDCDPGLIRSMHMLPAASPEEALRMADEIAGPSAAVTVIPDGVSVVVD